MRSRNKIGYLLLLCLLSLTACNDKEVYSKFHSFGGSAWSKAEPAEFELRIENDSLPYTVSLNVRNNNDYPFQNLWVFIEQKNPNGSTIRNTVNVELADVYGKWHGQGLSLYSYVFPFLTNYHFPDTGVYRFQITPAMRQETLPGISDIGLTVTKE